MQQPTRMPPSKIIDQNNVKTGGGVIELRKVVKASAAVADHDKVKLGGLARDLRKSVVKTSAAVADEGKVKIGGSSIDVRKPVVKTSAAVADEGKVKIGGLSRDLRKPAKA